MSGTLEASNIQWWADEQLDMISHFRALMRYASEASRSVPAAANWGES